MRVQYILLYQHINLLPVDSSNAGHMLSTKSEDLKKIENFIHSQQLQVQTDFK